MRQKNNHYGKKSNKLKQSLTHTVRKMLEKQPEKVYSHKQICDMVDARDGALRTLVFTVLKELVNQDFLTSVSYDTFKLNTKNQKIVEGTILLLQKDLDL